MTDGNLLDAIKRFVAAHPGAHLLDEDDSERFLDGVSRRFGFERQSRWWWQSSEPTLSVAYGDRDGLEELRRILPRDGELRLFMTDDDAPPWPCVAASSDLLIAFLQEQRFFEYCVLPLSMEWIVFDTHHNNLVLLGDLGPRGAMPPTSKSAEDIVGLEFDWLACDDVGHVAMFSTAGAGYAPDEFLRDTHAHDAAIEQILAQPRLTGAQVAPSLPPGLRNVWLLMAERGIFAYDCDPAGGQYRLVSIPAEPVMAARLSVAARDVATRLRLPIRFGARQVCNAEDIRRALVRSYFCRVCGLRHEDPPWGLDGRSPLFVFCECCGVEFGYQDATPAGARQFREEWVRTGATWEEPEKRPTTWDLDQQLTDVPPEFR